MPFLDNAKCVQQFLAEIGAASSVIGECYKRAWHIEAAEIAAETGLHAPEGNEKPLLNTVFCRNLIKDFTMLGHHLRPCLAAPVGDEACQVFVEGQVEFRLASVQFDDPFIQ